jgi:thymidylate synthase (FAD)
MKVTVLRSTERPERLVCQAGRGDYYDGYVGDAEYRELMEHVDVEERHYEGVSHDGPIAEGTDEKEVLKPHAQTRAFIEKQLSRGHHGLWEHPNITFALEGVSRVTMAQITRHRHMTFDVQSMRYVDFSEKSVVVPPSLMDEEERQEEYPHIFNETTDHFNRQDGLVEIDEGERQELRKRYEKKSESAFDDYQSFVDAGVPREDARFLLPLGTPVNMTFSGNARTFMHLLDMRKKPNAQWEIRELSEQLIEKLMDWMPYTYQYYEKNGPHKLAP